jgi:hypothetical protein
MIDRHARDQMEALIGAYMAGTLRSHELDDAKDMIAAATQDATVKQVGFTLWFFYDDIENHTIVADKKDWDCLNRLRLLLQSNGEIETIDKGRHWRWPQQVAAATLLGFGPVVWMVGWGENLLIYDIPFGIVSMVLAWFNGRRQQAELRNQAGLLPFPSFSSLRTAYRRVPGFVWVRYPRALARKRIRSRITAWIMFLPTRLAWLMFSPLVLACQALPERESEIRIKLSETPMTQTTTTT